MDRTRAVNRLFRIQGRIESVWRSGLEPDNDFHVSDLTRVIEGIQQGDPKAAEELLPLVYEELQNEAAVKSPKTQGIGLNARRRVDA